MRVASRKRAHCEQRALHGMRLGRVFDTEVRWRQVAFGAVARAHLARGAFTKLRLVQSLQRCTKLCPSDVARRVRCDRCCHFEGFAAVDLVEQPCRCPCCDKSSGSSFSPMAAALKWSRRKVGSRRRVRRSTAMLCTRRTAVCFVPVM